VEYANVIVTARGKPSGIATTTITTAIRNAEIAYCTAFSPLCLSQILIIKAINVEEAALTLIYPIYESINFNIISK
jgi:hypothetical protein